MSARAVAAVLLVALAAACGPATTSRPTDDGDARDAADMRDDDRPAETDDRPDATPDADDGPAPDIPGDDAPADDTPETDAGDDGAVDNAEPKTQDAEPDEPPAGDGPEADDDGTPLAVTAVEPGAGGASAPTAVVIRGSGFGPGMIVLVGETPAERVVSAGPNELSAVFPAVPLTARGVRDVTVERADGTRAVLPRAFEYRFDQDPIVFVHGLYGNAANWATMTAAFRAAGWPDSHLAAISYRNPAGVNTPAARDELAPFVDAVLARTGADRVDVVCHSMGGLSTRLWIKLFGGGTKVRDYVSLGAVHHGNQAACATSFLGDVSKELCPNYRGTETSFNGVLSTLNGDPATADTDETPFGVEDGGEIRWNAVWSDADGVVYPPQSGCLDQARADDCSAPINHMVSGVPHLELVTRPALIAIVQERLMRTRPPAR